MSGHGPQPHADGTTTFRVWAPRATAVKLDLGDERHDLEPSPYGWFQVRVAGGHGTGYAYRLDGGPARPDPASRRQPQGVHGVSQVVDPQRFAWTETASRSGVTASQDDPLRGAAIYELHVGTFTSQGTFDAAIAHLPALAELGITHVEVMPVNAYNGDRGWGYDGVAWYAVHEPYGGPEGFARFVDAAHRTGLAVLLDVVYNHLGPSGNFLPDYGPYLTDRYGTPWGEALNLDGPGSDPVRAFIIGNALAWLRDYRVDGLRLDAVHGLLDTSAVHLLAELSMAVAALGADSGVPRLLIAESDRCDPLAVLPRDQGGQGLDGQWSDDLHHAIHTALTGERDGYYVDFAGLPDLAEIYRKGWLFDGRYSTYRERTVGAPLPEDLSGHRLVTCIQNHDQVGNRAAGERLTTLIEPDLVRVAIVLLCASPTTPMLFMGEEYGETNPFSYFTSHPEPELAEAIRTGRRQEFAGFADFDGAVPDPQDPATFEASRLDHRLAETPAGAARRLLWSDLLLLRRKHAALGGGRRDLVRTHEAGETVLTLERTDPAAGTVLIAANLGEAPCELRVPERPWTPLLDTQDPRYGGDGDRASITRDLARLAPRSAALWAA